MLANIIKGFLLISFLLSAIIYVVFSPTHLKTVFYKGTIQIERDNFSIPTLHVSTIEQYLYALGTVYAEDRLFQIAFRSYAAQGRLSQFLGEKTLQFDRYMREINFKRWGEERAARFKRENATQYGVFQALAKGMNQRVAKMYLLPLDFYLTGIKWQNFTINHIFYLAVQFQWGVSMNIVDQYTRSALLANYTKEEIDWILPNKKENWAFQSIPIVSNQQIPFSVRTQNIKQKLQKVKLNPLSVDRVIQLDIIEFFSNSFDASNCWAVSGKYTQSGFPLLSTDPHLQNIVPSQWYQFIVNYKDENGKKAYSAGGTNPGSPHPYGKTSYFGMGFSVSHGDNQDLYRQKIQGNKYLVDGKWRDLKIRNQTILVKTGSGLRQDIYEVRQTHRGPIIHYIFGSLGTYSLENDTLSLAWTGFNNQWQSLIKLTYIFLIDNLDELRNAMQNQTKTFLNVNVIAITADDHIIMQQSGLQPIRRNNQAGTYIKDGTSTEHDWVGIVPPTDRIHLVDPPKGYVLNANNRLAESDYYGGYLDYTIYTARADRLDQIIRAEIESGRKISVEFAKKTLLDTVDVYCRQILPQIVKVVSEAQLITNFDCDFRAQSHFASIYQVFMYELYHLIKPFSPQKMSLITFHQMQQGIYNYIHFAYRGDAAKQQVMNTAWRKALLHLQNHFKTKEPSKWLWGELHIDTNQHVPFRNHPILSRIFNLEFPGSGNAHTPNVGKMEQLQFGNFRTTHRANSRAIYGFGQDHPSWYIVDTGTSENILSKHYSDQNELIQRGEMIEIVVNERKGQRNQDEDL